MGAVFYYQAVETYLANFNADDNTTVNTDGTVMEHHADEVFGYFGAPIDFPSNVSGIKYWSAYCNEVNTAISSNIPLMNGFLKLRGELFFNKDLSSKLLKKVRKGMQTQLPAAKFFYEDECGSCGELTPFFASVSNFFTV